MAAGTVGNVVPAGTVASIDVGTSKICAIVANVNVAENKIVTIHGIGIVPSRGIQKGVIQDLSGATAAIKDAIEKASAGAQLVSTPYVGFSGKHMSSTNPVVTVEPHNHKITEDTIKEAFERVESVKFPEDRIKVAVVPRSYTIDGIVKGIRNPLDMHGYRLDLEAHIISAGAAYLQNLEYCLAKTNINASHLNNHIIPNALVCGEAVLSQEERESGVILADIGGGNTDIAAYKEGNILHTSCIPVGGNHISNDLAIGLNIPFSAADEIKIKFGLRPNVELGDDLKQLMQKHRVTSDEVDYIIRARVEELLRMIIAKSPYKSNLLVITGGTAKLLGLIEFAQDILSVTVRIGKPSGLPEGAAILEDPAYSASVGLLLWGARLEAEKGIPTPKGTMLHFDKVGSGLIGGLHFIKGKLPFELKTTKKEPGA